MRRNRRLKKQAVLTMGSAGSIALIMLICAALLIYWSLDQRCTTIGREIGKAERECRALKAELDREDMKWNEMTSTQRLEEKLTRFGITMRRQTQDQVIRMSRDGRPLAGLAVARAKARSYNERIASADTPAPLKKQSRARR